VYQTFRSRYVGIHSASCGLESNRGHHAEIPAGLIHGTRHPPTPSLPRTQTGTRQAAFRRPSGGEPAEFTGPPGPRTSAILLRRTGKLLASENQARPVPLRRLAWHPRHRERVLITININYITVPRDPL